MQQKTEGKDTKMYLPSDEYKSHFVLNQQKAGDKTLSAAFSHGVSPGKQVSK